MSIGLCDENGNGRMAMIVVWRRNEGAAGVGLWRLGLAGLIALGVLVIGSLTAAATARADSCPNEVLRSELGSSNLGDCRAYEMVTPAYKEGYPLFSFSYSAGGEKAIVGGLANLAGAPGAGESSLEGDLYLDTRTAIGWQLAPLNAPLSQFIGQSPVAYEANSGETLWNQHRPTQSLSTRDLYARSAAGAYSLIGPLGVPFVGDEEEEDDYTLTDDITTIVRLQLRVVTNMSCFEQEAPKISGHLTKQRVSPDPRMNTVARTTQSRF